LKVSKHSLRRRRITIAASLFQDTANAVLLTIAFRWLG
jgi:hypothetical protein